MGRHAARRRADRTSRRRRSGARGARDRTGATMTAAVRAVAVRRQYGNGAAGVTALDNVSVAVPRGCFIAVVGPSGSGKSTLLHCLAGLDTPDSGKVYLGETELTRLSERDLTSLRRDRVGFVFQSLYVVQVRHSGANVMLPMRRAWRY